jgi:hypothetical protein
LKGFNKTQSFKNYPFLTVFSTLVKRIGKIFQKIIFRIKKKNDLKPSLVPAKIYFPAYNKALEKVKL